MRCRWLTALSVLLLCAATGPSLADPTQWVPTRGTLHVADDEIRQTIQVTSVIAYSEATVLEQEALFRDLYDKNIVTDYSSVGSWSCSVRGSCYPDVRASDKQPNLAVGVLDLATLGKGSYETQVRFTSGASWASRVSSQSQRTRLLIPRYLLNLLPVTVWGDFTFCDPGTASDVFGAHQGEIATCVVEGCLVSLTTCAALLPTCVCSVATRIGRSCNPVTIATECDQGTAYGETTVCDRGDKEWTNTWCEDSSACSGSETCVDGQCTQTCGGDADCPAESFCDAGVCTFNCRCGGSCGEATLALVSHSDGSRGWRCCQAPVVCDAARGRCVASCNRDGDCRLHQCCDRLEHTCASCVSTESSCTDGIDNDHDGSTDCEDQDCALDPSCDVCPQCPEASDGSSTLSIDDWHALWNARASKDAAGK